MSTWWIVMLPAEEAELSETYGPFRNESAARQLAAKWNSKARHDDQAVVLPVRAPSELMTAV